MEIIDRYVYAVTKHLPQTQREDITKELKSLIYDMQEERNSELGNENVIVRDILEELGDPKQLAESYRDNKRHLIGPKLFDSYVAILKIVVFAIAIASVTTFVIEIVTGSAQLLDNVSSTIIFFISTSIGGFAWVTIIFGFIEYYAGDCDGIKMNHNKPWRPDDLPPIPHPKREIKRYQSVIAILFNVFAMIMFLFFAQYIGAIVSIDGESTIIPFLNEVTFSENALFIYFILGMSILMECIKIIAGKWTLKLAWFTTLINLITFVIIVIMVSNQAIWNPHFLEQLGQSDMINVGSESFETITFIWDRSRMIVLLSIAVVLLIETVTNFVRALK